MYDSHLNYKKLYPHDKVTQKQQKRSKYGEREGRKHPEKK